VASGRQQLDCAFGLVNLTGRTVDFIRLPIIRTKFLGPASKPRAFWAWHPLLRRSAPPFWWHRYASLSTATRRGRLPRRLAVRSWLGPFVARAWEDESSGDVLPAQRVSFTNKFCDWPRIAGAGSQPPRG